MSELWLTKAESETLAQGDERVVAVACPNCHAPLLTRSILIGGQPSVCLDFVVCGGARSRRPLHVSSLEGDFTMSRLSEEIPSNAKLELFCPRCRQHLPEVEECGVCHRGRMVQLAVVGGKRSVRNVCPQRGCVASHEGEFSLPAWSSTFSTSLLLGLG